MTDRHASLKLLLVLAALAVLLGIVAPLPLNAQEEDDPLTLLSSDLMPFGAVRDGEPVGFAVEIIREISQRLGQEHRIEFGEWSYVYERSLTEPIVTAL